jgi:hypothetical protein
MRMGFLGMGMNIGIGLGLTAAPTVSQKNNDEGKIGNILTSEAGGYLNLGRPGVSYICICICICMYIVQK